MRQIVLALIITFTSSAYADSLGRLFFSPEQRLLLDSARRQKVKIEEKSEEQAPEIVSLNGVVKRSDGHTTVWLNNRAVSDRHAPGGVTITSQGSASDPVTFTMPQSERAVRLRVGQNLNVSTGQVVEPFDSKAAEMKRAFAAKQAEAAESRKPDETATGQMSPSGTSSGTAPARREARSQLSGTSTSGAPPQGQDLRKADPPASSSGEGNTGSQKNPSS